MVNAVIQQREQPRDSSPHKCLIEGSHKKVRGHTLAKAERVTQGRSDALASAPTPHQNAEPLTLMPSMEEYLKDDLT